MKRFMLAASLFTFAACAPSDNADTAAPAATTPAATTDSTAVDTTMRMDTTDTSATKM